MDVTPDQPGDSVDWEPTLSVAPAGLFPPFDRMPIPVPLDGERPMEIVAIPVPHRPREARTQRMVGMLEWNALWECAHLRGGFFKMLSEHKHSIPEWVTRYADERNIQFIADVRDNPRSVYLPLYAMLPSEVLRRSGLPPLGKCNLWPLTSSVRVEEPIFAGADERFAEALSAYLWPRLTRRLRRHAFSNDDPIRLIAHSPYFWLPHAMHVMLDRARQYEPDVRDMSAERLRQMDDANAKMNTAGVPVRFAGGREGGVVWSGDDEAIEATDEMIDRADRNGRLRSLIDAVLSNRVEDDFSPYWTREREDFERAVYHKRARVSVAFVELPQLEAIHSPATQMVDAPDADVIDRMMFNDFLALLDAKNRSIVICMRRGVTSASEISRVLGYANHSPVTKRLRKIRAVARKFFLEDTAT